MLIRLSPPLPLAARPIAAAKNLDELMTLYSYDPYGYGYADIVNLMRYWGLYPFENDLGLPVITFNDIKTKFK